MSDPQKGDYVLATKFSDGDLRDQWCIGFYDRTDNHPFDKRHYVVDEHGQQFRANGFRRVKKISGERGKWILENAKFFDGSGYSMWHLARCKMEMAIP